MKLIWIGLVSILLLVVLNAFLLSHAETVYDASYIEAPLPMSKIFMKPYIVVRNAIVERTITRYVTWTEYNLYMSDLYLGDTMSSVEHKNIPEATNTGLKSQNYLTKAVTGYKYAGLFGEYISPEIDRTFQKILDRQENVLALALKNTVGESRNLYDQMYGFLMANKNGWLALRKTMGRE